MKPSVARICKVMRELDISKFHPSTQIHHEEHILPLVEELEEIDALYIRCDKAIGQALDALIDGQIDDACSILRGALP